MQRIFTPTHHNHMWKMIVRMQTPIRKQEEAKSKGENILQQREKKRNFHRIRVTVGCTPKGTEV